MKPSENLYKFTRKEEGCILHAYRDKGGVWTIGIGLTRINGRPVRPYDTMTEAESDSAYHKEMDEKAAAVEALLGHTQLKQNQFDACCDFAYNEGTTAFQTSTLLKKIKACPSDPSIRDEFMKWDKYHKDGQLLESEDLKERRGREANLYFS